MSANPNDELPKTIGYAMTPNAYVNDHAEELCGLYDGCYFVCGSWDSGVLSRIGIDGTPLADGEWLSLARENVAALRGAGITENLLGVSFGSGDEWPCAELLLSGDFTSRMNRHFGALGRAAREAGFRGVSIDLEYPYPRYELDHEIYA